MVAKPGRYERPDSPHDDDLALPVRWAAWVLTELGQHGIEVAGAHRAPDGVWCPCDPRDLVRDTGPGGLASIGQRPSCGGVVTTVHLWDRQGLKGAFWLDRAPGGTESPTFRVLLLQALLRASPRELAD